MRRVEICRRCRREAKEEFSDCFSRITKVSAWGLTPCWLVFVFQLQVYSWGLEGLGLGEHQTHRCSSRLLLSLKWGGEERMWSATAEVKNSCSGQHKPGPRCASENLRRLCQLSQVAQTSQTLLCHVLTFWPKHHTSPFPVSFYWKKKYLKKTILACSDSDLYSQASQTGALDSTLLHPGSTGGGGAHQSWDLNW